MANIPINKGAAKEGYLKTTVVQPKPRERQVVKYANPNNAPKVNAKTNFLRGSKASTAAPKVYPAGIQGVLQKYGESLGNKQFQNDMIAYQNSQRNLGRHAGTFNDFLKRREDMMNIGVAGLTGGVNVAGNVVKAAPGLLAKLAGLLAKGKPPATAAGVAPAVAAGVAPLADDIALLASGFSSKNAPKVAAKVAAGGAPAVAAGGAPAVAAKVGGNVLSPSQIAAANRAKAVARNTIGASALAGGGLAAYLAANSGGGGAISGVGIPSGLAPSGQSRRGRGGAPGTLGGNRTGEFINPIVRINSYVPTPSPAASFPLRVSGSRIDEYGRDIGNYIDQAKQLGIPPYGLVPPGQSKPGGGFYPSGAIPEDKPVDLNQPPSGFGDSSGDSSGGGGGGGGGSGSGSGNNFFGPQNMADMMSMFQQMKELFGDDDGRLDQIMALYTELQKSMMDLQNKYIQSLIDAQKPVAPPVVPPPNLGPEAFVPPYISPSSQNGAYLELSDPGMGALFNMNPMYLQSVQQMLKSLGYTGSGVQGRYGERTYTRPGGPGSLAINDAAYENAANYVGLPQNERENAEAAMRYLFGEMGNSPRFAFPGRPQYPTRA